MEQKHFMDIEKLRENDEDIGNGVIKIANCQAGQICSLNRLLKTLYIPAEIFI